MTAQVQVLVVGAGPAGLTVALALAGQGVRVRVVDRRPGGAAGTGCHMVWPRTLEALDRAGLPVARLARRGLTVRRKVFHLGEESFSHGLEDPRGLWPLPLSVEQAVLEEELAVEAEALGVRVERSVEAVAVEQDAARAVVELRGPGGAERVTAGWVVLAQGGADGLRERLGFGWHAEPLPGGRVVHMDVELPATAGLAPSSEYIFLGRGRSAGLVPLPGGRHRLFAVLGEDGDVPGAPGPGAAGEGTGPTPGQGGQPGTPWPGVPDVVRELTGIEKGIRHLGQDWCFRPRHGIAASFRRGRCFLVGESAKAAPMPVHGMNGGVQDAYNLAWKLGAVLRGRAGEWLLDTYSAERRAVAEDVFGKARRILAFGTAPDPDATHGERVRRRRHDVKTEPPLRYHGEPLHHDGHAMPGPRVGEQLPDAPVVTPSGAPGTLLRSLAGGSAWTMLVMCRDGAGARAAGGARAAVAGVAALRVCVVGALPWEGAAELDGDVMVRLGDPGGTAHAALEVREPVVYLLRPDGHIGYRGRLADLNGLRAYAARVLRPGVPRPAAPTGDPMTRDGAARPRGRSRNA
ncbi:FAD-dependent oxidoreductase [Sphaerisporangium sp. TRM90804]|uniref:FAD-dependent oxidoreductase n=1 Tax=Sphaerisporangium sp. TRM90804 TaxID=3031113 RepID=UPI00244A9FF9|nr:FAD-dependent oxidoreductase [Sphaerisporangium sp. TRM90804]MDH2427221.1 FAD-dependent oxidoreductase [Sphaerisporangium sp. TRM90804]